MSYIKYSSIAEEISKFFSTVEISESAAFRLLRGKIGLGHADDLVEAVACLVHAEDHEQRNDHADKDQEDIQMVQVDAPALFPVG